MGRIRTKMTKRLAQVLVDRYPEKFSADFSQNRKFLDQLNVLEEKPMRNKVSGYIVRIVRKRK